MMKFSSNGATAKNSYNLRIFLLLSFILLILGLIALRLFFLQVVNHQHYQAMADNQHDTEHAILPNRGEIYLSSANSDEQPVLVATNVTKNLVYANQRQITNPANIAQKLAPLLEMEKQDIIDRLTGNMAYSVIKKQLSDEVSEQIENLELTGIYLEPETVRFYPEDNLASQVIGFLGYKGNQRAGQYGVEGKFESNLAGKAGLQNLNTDTKGRWITFVDRLFVPSKDGDDIYLTIDPAIQFKSQEVLKKTVEQHGAEAGSVVVVDPKSGAILAMANYPDFDPNTYNKVESPAVYSNRVLSADYEPGSVFKPITMAAAINEGKITPETTYKDEGVVQVDDKQIKNSDGKANDIQTMTQVLEKSLNTGLVYVQQQIGNDTFKKYVQRFGFGKLVDFPLPGQVIGNLDNLNRKGNIFFATASYGQGITVTGLQLIQAYTTLANGGKMMQPYILDKIVYSDGSEDVTKPDKGNQIIDTKTAATVSAMLVNVVENGHGKPAAVPGYYIAGKTGTAQVAYTDRVGYDPSKSIGSFIGFGPVDDPRFLMLVRIDNPQDVKFAESTAAPAFGEIASFILNYLQVPPTRN